MTRVDDQGGGFDGGLMTRVAVSMAA